MKPKKTGKREIAYIAFAVWIIITFQLFFRVSPADITLYFQIYSTVTGTAWVYIGFAMGLDWTAKQTSLFDKKE